MCLDMYHTFDFRQQSWQALHSICNTYSYSAREAHTHDARQRYGDDIRRQILSPIYINFIKHKHKSKVYLCITCVLYACVCVCVCCSWSHAGLDRPRPFENANAQRSFLAYIYCLYV